MPANTAGGVFRLAGITRPHTDQKGGVLGLRCEVGCFLRLNPLKQGGDVVHADATRCPLAGFKGPALYGWLESICRTGQNQFVDLRPR